MLLADIVFVLAAVRQCRMLATRRMLFQDWNYTIVSPRRQVGHEVFRIENLAPPI